MNLFSLRKRYTRHRYRMWFRGYLANLYGARHPRRALIVYVTKPFTRKNLFGHSNVAESHVIARLFDQLGYTVDVVDYFHEGRLDYGQYDVVFGFGEPMERSFAAPKLLRRVYYGTTCHVTFNNNAELRRVRDAGERTGHWFAPRRLLERAWSRSTGLADALVILGNAHTAGTYRLFPGQEIFSLNATGLATAPVEESPKNLARARNAFVWFGSTTGGIHKGLDLCLEYFAARPHLTLHVCGRIEGDLAAAYQPELARPNIVSHGFVDVRSPAFVELVQDCAFALLPTCSEGQSTSLLTLMRWGVIPVTTAAAGIDLEGRGVLIKDLTVPGVGEAVERAQQLPGPTVEQMARANVDTILRHHTLEQYEANLATILRALLQRWQAGGL